MAKKKIIARSQPNGDGHQVSYEIGSSRRVHHFPRPKPIKEPSPHAAGSFHDPEHHYRWIERVEIYLKQQE